MDDGKSADDVYKLLRLDAEGSNILKSPKLAPWMVYASKLGKDPYDLLLFKMRPRYDEAGLAKMLALSKNDVTTRAIAERLEMLQLAKWRKNDKSIIDVFNLLKLNKEGTTLLTNPALGTWASYVRMAKKDPAELLFSAIKSNGFDEAALAKMIGTAKQDINTGHLAAKMEKLQMDKWSSERKSGDKLFALLGLNKEREKLFESPVWSTWVSYLKRNGDSYSVKTMFTVLRKEFGDEALTNMVAKAKESGSTREIAAKLEPDVWWMNGRTSEDVFNLLKLNKKGNKVLESPELSTWVAYVQKLSNIKKKPDPFLHITHLEKQYGDAQLARMIAKSKKHANTESTKRFITDLQDLQFKKWREQGARSSVVAMLEKKDPISKTVANSFYFPG